MLFNPAATLDAQAGTDARYQQLYEAGRWKGFGADETLGTEDGQSQATAPALKKPPKSAEPEKTPASDPVIGADAAALYLAMPKSTLLRKAHKGEIPSIPFSDRKKREISAQIPVLVVGEVRRVVVQSRQIRLILGAVRPPDQYLVNPASRRFSAFLCFSRRVYIWWKI